jgi:hypothetical protein
MLLRLEEVQMTVEEDKKHVLSYIGYGAVHKNCFGSLEKKINSHDPSKLEGSNWHTDM